MPGPPQVGVSLEARSARARFVLKCGVFCGAQAATTKRALAEKDAALIEAHDVASKAVSMIHQLHQENRVLKLKRKAVTVVSPSRQEPATT